MAEKNAPTAPSDLIHVPPQNIEAEEAILSAVIVQNQTLLEVVEILSPDDFYRTAHQKIYHAMLEMFDRTKEIDYLTLTNHLKEQGQLEAIGGAAYLTRIREAPLAANAAHYARIVRDKAVLRHLIEKSNAIAKRCYQEQGQAEDIVEFAESAIFEITDKKVSQSFSEISKLIEANMDFIDDKQKNKSLVTGVTTGFKEIDNLTSGLQPSDLIILAARPSMGKTALALNIARNAAVKGNVPVAVFSVEMSKEQLSMRMLCSEASIDSSKLRSGFLGDEDFRSIAEAAGILSSAPIFIDDSPSISAMEVRAKARRLRMEKKIGLVVIDYLQLMQGRANAERRDLEISDISRSLKALAKEINVPVIALSQLNRMLEQRTDRRPRLSDLRESGALEQDADVVVFIYRDEVYNKEETNPERGKAEIIVAKHRNGPTGEVKLAFLSQYTRFDNLAPSSSPHLG